METITYVTCANDRELLEVLALQRANLWDQLPAEESQTEGFVTVSHTLELLRDMNAKCPHILAKSGKQVVGYALCMHPNFKEKIEVLKPMFREIEKVLPKNESYLIMGQICIAKSYRRKGIFRGLYEKMRAVSRDDFSSIITEVDSRNQRSMLAHYAVGFRDFCRYKSGGRLWHLVQLK